MIVTGETKTRLSELRKYKLTGIFTQDYRGNGSASNDGVAFNQSDPETEIVYYIGGIKYVDDVVNSITRFEFTAVGTNSPDFINVPIYKDHKKENIISRPKIQDGVFIIRQELSAFEKNYKLQHINNLSDLNTYLGGNYFNIVNNT
jgi:hypothetical protein